MVTEMRSRQFRSSFSGSRAMMRQQPKYAGYNYSVPVPVTNASPGRMWRHTVGQGGEWKAKPAWIGKQNEKHPPPKREGGHGRSPRHEAFLRVPTPGLFPPTAAAFNDAELIALEASRQVYEENVAIRPDRKLVICVYRGKCSLTWRVSRRPSTRLEDEN